MRLGLPSLRIAARAGASALIVACLAAPFAARAADDIVLTLQRVSEHCWFFRGETGAASAANKGFMMGRAVKDLEPFDAAYANTDWSRYDGLPAFAEANRINAWGTYLLLEQEALAAAKP
jgi:seryl-tRNA synthetase